MNKTPEFLLPFLPAGATSGYPGPGDYVKPDGWDIGSNLSLSDWDAAMFRLPLNSNGPIKSLAVNIEITSRKVTFRLGANWVRVRITFVGDCEPDTVTSGWMLIDPARKKADARFSNDFSLYYGRG